MSKKIYERLQSFKQNKKCGFAVLADPDKTDNCNIENLANLCNHAAVDFLMVGGSLLINGNIENCINQYKSLSNIPVLLFPGSPLQVTSLADGLLYLSLISGRNPDLLIGQHVISAPLVRSSGVEVISTGYVLVDGGKITTVSYISNSMPIPADKPEIALSTSWAGEMLGLKLIYLDSGSGAHSHVPLEMINMVSKSISIPLITGGGVNTPDKAYQCAKSGANLIVVGNAIEKDTSLIAEIAAAIREANL